MKKSNSPKISIPRGTAPGLFTRKERLLRQTLGLNEGQDPTPMQIHGLQSHPNPDIAAAAKSFKFPKYGPPGK